MSAIGHNVAELARLAGSSELCVVVKADGYGHGAVQVARAALGSGATRLAVALVEEGIELREAGIDAPILLLSEPPLDAFEDAWAHHLTPTIYHEEAVARASETVGRNARWGVHLKVDTGMHRVGATPRDAVDLAARVLLADNLLLEGVFTHLAVADTPQRSETDEQLRRFGAVLADLDAAGIDPGVVHAANSAGLLAHPGSHFAMVRAGIAAYGIPPSPHTAGQVELRPAMSVHAEVTHVHTVPAGEGVSYGLVHVFDVDTIVAVVPVGYADGIPRNFGAVGGAFLVGGIPRPVRGVVTMDQTVIEVGPVGHPSVVPVHVGDEVVLLGSQLGPDGPVEVSAVHWATILDTIPYEVVCRFSARLPRRHLRGR